MVQRFVTLPVDIPLCPSTRTSTVPASKARHRHATPSSLSKELTTNLQPRWIGVDHPHRIPEGLSFGHAQQGGIPEDLPTVLPVRRS